MADSINSEFENKLWGEVEKIVYRQSSDQSHIPTTWSSEEEKSKFLYNLLSPLLTRYGMDKDTKHPKLLKDMGLPEELDCCHVLGKRSFVIVPDEANNLPNIYSGKNNYLDNIVGILNQKEKAIIPLKVNSPNHGFFQAVSVALVGKEIFWHPLQSHFCREMRNNADKFQRQKQFISKTIWDSMLTEIDSDNMKVADTPPKLEMLFIMANILRRPIILLDSDVNSDSAGLFLPVHCPRDKCYKHGLCLAWEDNEKKKFIAVAGVKGNCKLLLNQLPKVWGNIKEKATDYLPTNQLGQVSISGKPLTDQYLNDLIDCMKQLHMEEEGVGVNLVCDIYRCIFQPAGFIDAPASFVLSVAKAAIADQRIYKCLDCRYTGVVPRYMVADGILHKQAIKQHGEVDFEKTYCFPHLGIQGKADRDTRHIVSLKSICRLLTCPVCHKKRMRKVTTDGDAVYFNGDVMPNGKYFWKGKEYDSKPKVIPIGLEWMGKVIPSNIEWFCNETDETSNSTFEGVVDILVKQHYPEVTEPRLRERVKHIVRMRLEQQQDLDIPGIEKRKPQNIPALLESLQKEVSTTGILVGSSGGPSSMASSTSLDLDDDLYGVSGSEGVGSPVAEILDENVITPPDGFDDQTHTGTENTRDEETANDSESSDDDLYAVNKSQGLMVTPSPAPLPQHSLPSRVPSTITATPMKPTMTNITNKTVKVVANQGKIMMTVTLPQNVTYNQLQLILEKQTSIPSDKQDIKSGFPPKDIRPKNNQHLNLPLDNISNGDRLIVEEWKH